MSAPLEWSDELGSRSRKPWLLLIHGDAVTAFAGATIPGIVTVVGTDYRRNGKWSHTTYRLLTQPGVRCLSGRDGWETGRFVEGLASATGRKPVDTWEDVATAMGVSVVAAMSFLRAWRPRAAEALDSVAESIAAAVDAAEDEGHDVSIERHVVSFGAPTKRERANGFWTRPQSVPGTGAEVYLQNECDGWVMGNVGLRGAAGTVIDVKQSSGHGGGYVAVTVALVKP